MALNNLGLGFVITARDQASGVLRGVGGSLGHLRREAGLTGGAMRAATTAGDVGARTMAVGVGVLSGAFGAAVEAGHFQQDVTRVGQITQASAADLRALRDAAVEAGLATQFSPRQAISGLGQLGAQGFTASESIGALNSVLNLAQAGNISVAQSAETLSATLRSYQMDASNATNAANQLLRISNLSSISTNELARMIGTVSRGAVTAGQSLDEMLISMSLVRSVGMPASVAASAVSVALSRVAARREDFRSVGVEVVDSTGRIRNFLDILVDTSRELTTRYPNAAERSAQASRLFGERGLAAFSSFEAAVRRGIRNSEGDLLRGVDAIRYLREQASAAGAEGVAARFTEALKRDLKGQLKILEGAVQTLVTLVGEPLAEVFFPFVRAAAMAISAVARFVNTMPSGFKKIMAVVIVFVGVLTMAAGAVTVLGIGIFLLIPALKVLAITFGVVIAVATPLIAVIGTVTATFLGLWEMARRNWGGLGTAISTAFRRISLAWRALGQVFGEGYVSGKVMEELEAAENQGVMRFVGRVFAIVHRIREFFRGVSVGIGRGLKAVAPIISGLVAAFRDLGRTLGFVGEEGSDLVMAISGRDFAERGEAVGRIIADAFGRIVDIIRKGVILVDGFVGSLNRIRDAVGPSIGPLTESFTELFRVFSRATEPIRTLVSGMATTDQQARGLGATLAGNVGGGLNTVVKGLTFGARIFGIWVTVGSVILRVYYAVYRIFRNLFGGIIRGIRDVFELSGVFGHLKDVLLSIWAVMEPAFGPLVQAIVELGRAAMGALSGTGEGFGELTVVGTTALDVIRWIGRAIGWVAGALMHVLPVVLTGVAYVIWGVVTAIAWLIREFQRIPAVTQAMWAVVVRAFYGIRDAILNSLDAIIIKLADVAAALPEQFRPSFVGALIREGESAEARMGARREAAAAREGLRLAGGGVAAMEAPAAAAMEVGAGRRAGEVAELTGMREALLRTSAATERVAHRPVQVNVELDGELVGRGIGAATREVQEASGMPVGVFGVGLGG